MSLRSMSHAERVAELTAHGEQLGTVSARLAELADAADAVSTSDPATVPTVLVEGIRRPTEDLVVARERLGVYAALGSAQSHAIQAVLHVEQATRAAERAVAAFEHVRD